MTGAGYGERCARLNDVCQIQSMGCLMRTVCGLRGSGGGFELEKESSGPSGEKRAGGMSEHVDVHLAAVEADLGRVMEEERVHRPRRGRSRGR